MGIAFDEKRIQELSPGGITTGEAIGEAAMEYEDVYKRQQLDYLRTLLNKYLTIEDIDTFTRNLIHNFSLGNALDTLSILDAKKLLEFVEGAVNQMQLQLDRRFYGNTLAGLYIHLCCMIERLVTKEPITNHEGLQQFEKENRKFIEIVRRSFTKAVSYTHLLQTARKHHFAVGAFNVCDSLLFSTVMECAEEQHAPVIVELAPPEFSYVGSDFFAYAVKRMQNSSVPCVLHLDHGKTIQDCILSLIHI